MLITIFLLSQPSPPSIPIVSPPPPLTNNRPWYEVLLDPPVLIPVIIGIIVVTFLFIFIFRYCNRERSDSLSNVIDSVGIAASRIQGKKISKEENDNVIYIGTDKKQPKTPPSIKFK